MLARSPDAVALRQGELPERIIEMSCYHAMMGCAAAGMGMSLMPKSVVDSFPEKRRLSVHKLGANENRSRISLIWRKGARSPKIDALIDVLRSDVNGKRALKAPAAVRGTGS